jgi:hypothetical protein
MIDGSRVEINVEDDTMQTKGAIIYGRFEPLSDLSA